MLLTYQLLCLVMHNSVILYCRYSSVSRFIGKTLSKTESLNLDKLNDIDANIDEDLFQYILEDMNTNKENTDINLAKHLAHLFIRDPLVIFDDAIYLDDNKSLVKNRLTNYSCHSI